MQNLKICFEGPSAIGKSSLAQLFCSTHHVVKEVNELFPHPTSTDKFWYLERQVERYQIACASTQPVIFDGDPFQPLWYNWIFPPPKDSVEMSELHAFYRQKIKQDEIAFPDLYLIFTIETSTLIERKENDRTRRRRNFEKHLRFIEPQKRFFQYLKDYTELNIHFINLEDLQTTYHLVLSIAMQSKHRSIDQLSNYEAITNWLTNTSPQLPKK